MRSEVKVGDRTDLLERLADGEKPGVLALSIGSSAKVAWRCELGHEFDRAVRQMAKKPSSCPFCDNRQVLVGFNDLAARHPSLASEWHPSKNADLSPNSVLPGSPRKVWWQGPCGHSWDAEIRSRVRGYGCAVCAGMRTDVSTSIASSWPAIHRWWHPQNDLSPTEVHRGSEREFRFRCPASHEFSLPLHVFLKRATKCQECRGEIVIPGVNSLADSHPRIAALWSPSNLRSSHEVSAADDEQRSFICQEGHEFTASPRSLTTPGSRGCPVCAGVTALSGVTDLATTHPALCVEWDDPADPTRLTWKSKQKVFWRCSRGHRWPAAIAERVRGSGCPVCVGLATDIGVNDLTTTHPEWAAQWHPDNSPLRPQDVKATSGRPIRWRAQECGHEWTQAPRRRPKAYLCPVCSGSKAVPGCNDVTSTHPLALTLLADAGLVNYPALKGRAWRLRVHQWVW